MTRYTIRTMSETTRNRAAGENIRARRASPAGARLAAAELERRERQLAALYELWRSVPHTEPGLLLQIVAERATATMDAHTCSVLLRQRGTDTLKVAGSVGLPVDVAESVTLLVGERIAGRVAATCQPILVNKDPRSHPMLANNPDGSPTNIDARPEVESALCAPLMGASGDHALGVICLSRHTPAAPFTDADLRVVALFAAQAGAVIAQHQVIDDLTRAADERASMEREMARSAHLASLGQFAAMVAHELRNPLGSIKGAAQYLLTESGDDTVRDFLNIVVEEVDGLGRLTTDLLEFARPTPPVRAPHDLVALVKAEVAFLHDELARLGITRLIENYAVDSAIAQIDPAQIGRALRNLLLNAAQAMASTPNARIAGAITIGVAPDDTSHFLLTVEDDGPGLPDSVRARLFEPFFTTKARGTGLGLAHVRRTIEMHDGSVSADNGKSGGARFVVRLPGVGSRE